jgi:hypothetical protein
MKKLSLFILILLFSREGIVSQVMEMPEDMLPTLEEMVERSDHIAVLEPLGEKKEYYKKVFPKETHYQKGAESIYTETVYSYKVIKVIKSNTLKANHVIWIWRLSAYGEGAIQLQHEEGLLESPYQSVYRPKNQKNKDDKSEIFFLKDIQKSKLKDTYDNFEYGAEGLATEPEIVKQIKEKRPY